jgi:hypothetical protein
MSEAIFEPIPVTYLGLYADSHFVDAQQFGKSIIATSKIANSICHFLLFSEITHDTRAFQVKFFVGPSKENGLIQELFAIMNSGQFPAFTPAVMEIAKPFIEHTFDAMIKTVLGKKDDANVSLEIIREMANRHADFSDRVHAGHLREKERLMDIVERLIGENRAPLREVPEPVGKSVREMRIGKLPSPTIVDEPAAEALRSREHLTVGDSATYNARIEGVFKTNGACRIRLLDNNQIVSGKITDPSLGQPGNVYTAALNEGTNLQVTAKPTLKDGAIKRLFVSDAKVSPDSSSSTVGTSEPAS